ncbi:hypothetical protein L1E13_01820 [Enterobacter hormaechei]|uniref:hypothetical protein n=1 Tax=Enterobacter hormaechei TaxID=158836 RepID=UPI001F1DCB07|nr:hypothetical protein [Enterobacter hormaechei]UJA60593.1 hypothetical protein L1E13_01820 [Enterobacter hormaechei]
MDIHRIKRVHHFYYCLLIAVKMYRCERPSLNRIDENTFIYTWLKKTAKNNIFECALHDEIAWLRTQLRGHGIRSDVAKMVENIVVKLDFLLSVEEEVTT